MTATWQDKAHRIIHQLCVESYLQANELPNGRLRRCHVPYAIPEEAQQIIEWLNTDNEIAAKFYFIQIAYR